MHRTVDAVTDSLVAGSKVTPNLIDVIVVVRGRWAYWLPTVPRSWAIAQRIRVTAAVEPASAHSTVLRKDTAMGQDGHACMASAETSRNSFSVAPLAD